MEINEVQNTFVKNRINKGKILKCIVVDNDAALSKRASQQIEDAGGKIVAVCSDSLELEESLDIYKVDLVFINTKLGTNRDVANLINDMIGGIPKIPYTNENNNLYSFTEPTSILKFPTSKINIVNSIKVAMAEKPLGTSKEDGSSDMNTPIFFRVDGKMISLKPCAIRYIESVGNYVHIFTKNEKLSIRSSIKKIIDLLDSPYFFQVQRAYIVNINYISELVINSNQLMIDDISIPIGRRFKKATIDKLRQHRS